MTLLGENGRNSKGLLSTTEHRYKKVCMRDSWKPEDDDSQQKKTSEEFKCWLSLTPYKNISWLFNFFCVKSHLLLVRPWASMWRMCQLLTLLPKEGHMEFCIEWNTRLWKEEHEIFVELFSSLKVAVVILTASLALDSFVCPSKANPTLPFDRSYWAEKLCSQYVLFDNCSSWKMWLPNLKVDGYLKIKKIVSFVTDQWMNKFSL